MRYIKLMCSVIGSAAICIAILTCAGNEGPDDTRDQSRVAAGSLYTDLLVTHLKEHFEDIHEVSMRYHHMDPSLGGLILIRTQWVDDRLQSSSITQNETGNSALGDALIEALNTWKVDGLKGPLEITIPIRIKLVGSDDPEFSHRGIVTGTVVDKAGIPVSGAEVSFSSSSSEVETVTVCRSNREGIFVRTLIPPGRWTVSCIHDDFRSPGSHAIEISAGQHIRQTFTLERESN